MTREEIEFNYIYGTIFSADTSAEYCDSLGYVMDEKGLNYERNLAAQAGKACKKLSDALRRVITRGMNAEQKAIALAAVEHHKDIVYDFFLLDSHAQRRVQGLIQKLRKEAAAAELNVTQEAAA